MKKKAKKYILTYAIIFGLAVVFVTGLTVYIDPYFHYHKPTQGFTYELDNQRYQNYGILNHFEYNAMITGSSMTENFKASELDSLFGVNSVKTSFSGGHYKEIDQAIQYAINKNEDLEMVIRSLDMTMIVHDKDSAMQDTSSYPWYLYDDNLFNDVSYVYNMETLIAEIIPILETRGTTNITSFDVYSNWNDFFTFGKETVLESYTRSTDKVEEQKSLTEQQVETVQENIQQNVVETIANNSDIEFYFFIPPYSIVWWDGMNNDGNLNSNLEAQKMLIEALLPYPNCKLFSFNTEFDISYDNGIFTVKLLLNC